MTNSTFELIEIPDKYLESSHASSAAFDPVVLRAAAMYYASHPFDNEMTVKGWIVAFLLDQFMEANDSTAADCDNDPAYQGLRDLRDEP